MMLLFFLAQQPSVPVEVTSWMQIVTNLGFGGLVVYLLVMYLPNVTREHRADMEGLRKEQKEERAGYADERKEMYRVVAGLRESITALTDEIRKRT